jgi:cytochrome P450
MTQTAQAAAVRPWPFNDMSAPDPAPGLADLPGTEPVARAISPTGVPVWLVSREQDARTVLTDPRFSRAAYVADPERSIFAVPQVSGGLAAAEGPGHLRLRKLVSGAFTRRRVESLRPFVQRTVASLLGGYIAAGPGADLVPLVAEPLPVMVVCELTGVPYADRDKFFPGTETLLNVDAYTAAEVETRRSAMIGYIAGLMQDKARHPGDDLFSALVTADDGDGPLSPADLIGLGVFLLGAGLETTAQQIALSTLTLLRHPAQWQALREDPALIPGAVTELLRYTPTVPAALPRAATEDLVLGGVTIQAGDVVIPVLATANREAASSNGDELDVHRPPVAHLTFGYGMHRCLGAPVAQLILAEWLAAVTQRLPGLKLGMPAADITWRLGHAARGPVSLPLAW